MSTLQSPLELSTGQVPEPYAPLGLATGLTQTSEQTQVTEPVPVAVTKQRLVSKPMASYLNKPIPQPIGIPPPIGKQSVSVKQLPPPPIKQNLPPPPVTKQLPPPPTKQVLSAPVTKQLPPTPVTKQLPPPPVTKQLPLPPVVKQSPTVKQNLPPPPVSKQVPPPPGFEGPAKPIILKPKASEKLLKAPAINMAATPVTEGIQAIEELPKVVVTKTLEDDFTVRRPGEDEADYRVRLAYYEAIQKYLGTQINEATGRLFADIAVKRVRYGCTYPPEVEKIMNELDNRIISST